MTARRFCVMTVGRTGSTWLMQTLADFPDVAVPAKNVESPDNELITPGMPPKYAELVGRTLSSTDDLIEAFFVHNAARHFAGFKSMPNRHPNFRDFVRRRDITFITLDRRHVTSTVASFLMARQKGTWRRAGGTPEESLVFTAEVREWVARNVHFILESKLQLASIQPAIRLVYEELCQPDFASAELDAFFGRPVRLAAAKPPIQAQDYVENWQELREFVKQTWTEKCAALPPRLRSLL